MTSSRHPDKWIVPGGGMEPEEEPSVAATREVCEEVGFHFGHIFIFFWSVHQTGKSAQVNLTLVDIQNYIFLLVYFTILGA